MNLDDKFILSNYVYGNWNSEHPAAVKFTEKIYSVLWMTRLQLRMRMRNCLKI